MNKKKYVLAKDLPFARKGAKVGTNFRAVYVGDAEDLFTISSSTNNPESELERMISEGWIEEIKPGKPLEIWVNQYELSANNNHLGTYNYSNLEEAIKESKSLSSYIRTIHFVEVPDGDIK